MAAERSVASAGDDYHPLFGILREVVEGVCLRIEDQIQTKRCGHRQGNEIVSQGEMVDRIKLAVDACTDSCRRKVSKDRRRKIAAEG